MLAAVSFPIYIRALVNVLSAGSRSGTSPVAWPAELAVQLHGAAGAHVHLPAPHLGGAVWRDIGHSQLTLATVWNITNTVILGVFVVAGLREHRRLLHPRPAVAPSSRQATARARATVSARTAVARPSAPAPEPVLSAPVPSPLSAVQRLARLAHLELWSPLMTWSNRFRLYGGLIVVIALVAALTLVFNQRRSQALSLTAHVVADQVTVGAQFGGVVVDQKVAAGDTVDKGDSLYTVVVPRTVGNAGEAVAAVAPVRNAAYVVDPKKSTVTYRALTTGVLTDVQSTEGGFVQSGAALATITAVGRSTRSPSSGSRRATTAGCETGAHVDLLLPDNRTVPGEVRARVGDHRRRGGPDQVTISSDALRDAANAKLTAPGTPLSATLSLRDDGPLAGPTDAMVDFLRKIGVR